MPTYYSMIFFFMCLAVVGLYLLVNAFNNKPVDKLASAALKMRGAWSWRIALMITIVIAVDLTPGGWVGSRSTLTNILADLAALAGVVVVIWARHELGRNWSSMAQIKQDHELIKTGPYRYVRHPMYGGFLFFFAAMVLLFVSIKMIVFFVLGMVIVWLRVREEEMLLTKRFPREYPEYQRRTKALIPFVL